MAADANLTKAGDLEALSVDFVENFNSNVTKLLQVLGTTRKIALPVGSQIKVYKKVTTLADGNVGEGEEIPLSKVTKKLDHTETLTWNKYRKQTSAEAIQSSGFVGAINDTDTEILKQIQANLKKALVNETVKSGTTTVTGVGLQQALAKALGQLAVKWEDSDVQSVAFINPIDFYDYLGSNQLTVQDAFGMQYIQNFLGVNTVILTGAMPQGKLAVTAAQNIVYAYAPVTGQVNQAFNFTTDQTGLVGIAHNTEYDNMTYETVVILANDIFAEKLDGIITATVSSPVSPTGVQH